MPFAGRPLVQEGFAGNPGSVEIIGSNFIIAVDSLADNATVRLA
jgi:hypothetical protein